MPPAIESSAVNRRLQVTVPPHRGTPYSPRGFRPSHSGITVFITTSSSNRCANRQTARIPTDNTARRQDERRESRWVGVNHPKSSLDHRIRAAEPLSRPLPVMFKTKTLRSDRNGIDRYPRPSTLSQLVTLMCHGSKKAAPAGGHGAVDRSTLLAGLRSRTLSGNQAVRPTSPFRSPRCHPSASLPRLRVQNLQSHVEASDDVLSLLLRHPFLDTGRDKPRSRRQLERIRHRM